MKGTEESHSINGGGGRQRRLVSFKTREASALLKAEEKSPNERKRLQIQVRERN